MLALLSSRGSDWTCARNKNNATLELWQHHCDSPLDHASLLPRSWCYNSRCECLSSGFKASHAWTEHRGHVKFMSQDRCVVSTHVSLLLPGVGSGATNAITMGASNLAFILSLLCGCTTTFSLGRCRPDLDADHGITSARGTIDPLWLDFFEGLTWLDRALSIIMFRWVPCRVPFRAR